MLHRIHSMHQRADLILIADLNILTAQVSRCDYLHTMRYIHQWLYDFAEHLLIGKISCGYRD
ncbi:hypothetical protein D1872_273100 [compost metagenome]